MRLEVDEKLLEIHGKYRFDRYDDHAGSRSPGFEFYACGGGWYEKRNGQPSFLPVFVNPSSHEVATINGNYFRSRSLAELCRRMEVKLHGRVTPLYYGEPRGQESVLSGTFSYNILF